MVHEGKSLLPARRGGREYGKDKRYSMDVSALNIIKSSRGSGAGLTSPHADDIRRMTGEHDVGRERTATWCEVVTSPA